MNITCGIDWAEAHHDVAVLAVKALARQPVTMSYFSLRTPLNGFESDLRSMSRPSKPRFTQVPEPHPL